MGINKIYQGNCLEILKTFPNDSIDCIISSPPYWGVRDYGDNNDIIWDEDPKCEHNFILETKKNPMDRNGSGDFDKEGIAKSGYDMRKREEGYCSKCGAWKGQLGLEDHPQKYIDHIVEIMKECKRVIKNEGTIFLNLGDSFYTKSGSGQGSNYLERHKQLDGGNGVLTKAHTQTRGKYKSNWLQTKQKLLIPHRIAIKCQDELGLIVRNDIHWIKQFVDWGNKQSYGTSYPSSVQDRLSTNAEFIFFFVKSPKYYFNLDAIRVPHKEISLNRIKYGHKSTEGSPYTEQCDGQDMKRFCNPKGKNPGDCIRFPFDYSTESHFAVFPKNLVEFCILCGCPENGIVLDPFAGSGTTLFVAKHMKRNYIGIELNPDYIRLIEKKLAQEILK
jgi:DNA modification methylase